VVHFMLHTNINSVQKKSTSIKHLMYRLDSDSWELKG